MQFTAENSTGCKIPIEPAGSMGGSGKVPDPVNYLLAALGSYRGIIMVMGFSVFNDLSYLTGGNSVHEDIMVSSVIPFPYSPGT
jgi:hypothetical protein